MKFRADAAIDHIGQGSTIVHAHVILVLEAFNLEPRHTFCHRLVPHIHRIVDSWDRLGCVAHGERVHFRAQAYKLDDRIALGLVLDVAHFSAVYISITTSEVRKVAIINLAKVEGVLKMRARVYLFCQVFNKEVKEEKAVSV